MAGFSIPGSASGKDATARAGATANHNRLNIIEADNSTDTEREAAVAALQVSLGDKVDQATYDAMIAGNATDAELAAVKALIDAEQAAQDAATALKADQAALDAEITARTDADAAHVADRAYHALAATAADNGKVMGVVAGQVTLVDGANTTGQLVGVSQTYLDLPAVPADASATVKYHAWLSEDDIGTGTADAPQYPKGFYVPDAGFTTWDLAVSSGSAVGEITEAEATSQPGDAEYSKFALWSAERADQHLADRQTPTSFIVSDMTPVDIANIADRRVNIRYFIANTNQTTVLELIYSKANEIALTVTSSMGNRAIIAAGAANTSVSIPPNSWGILEYHEGGTTADLKVFSGDQRFDIETKPAGPLIVPYNVQVFIRDTTQTWANVTGVTEEFTGDETANWKIINGELPVYHHAADGVGLVGRNNVANGFTITLPSVVAEQEITVTEGAKANYYYANDAADAWIQVEGAAPADMGLEPVGWTKVFEHAGDLAVGKKVGIIGFADRAAVLDAFPKGSFLIHIYEGDASRNGSSYEYQIEDWIADGYPSFIATTYDTNYVSLNWDADGDVTVNSVVSMGAGSRLRIYAKKGAADFDTANYVDKDAVIPIDEADVVLINADAVNNTLYSFSTGETWADIKANYERLIITGNASRSGSNQIRPWSFVLDLGDQLNGIGQNGYRMDLTNDYSVTIWCNNPADTDTGLTYRQSGGDSPSNGRMQFKVVGVKKTQTVSV